MGNATIRIVCALGLMCASLVWGQSRPLKTYKTDAGCNVLMPGGDAVLEEPLQWTGRCQDGLISGLGILSYQFNSGSFGILRWHHKIRFLNGKEHGAGWYAPDPVLKQNNDPNHLMILYLKRDGERLRRVVLLPSNSLDISLQKAEEIANEAVSLGLPTMTADELKDDIRQWHQNPGQYTGGAKAAGGVAQRGTDDPKTLGRGMRGG